MGLIDRTYGAQVVRRVNPNADATYTVSDVSGEPEFALEIRSATRVALRDLEAPRSLRASEGRYRKGATGPSGGPLTPGSRILLSDNTIWETLDRPRELFLGRHAVAYDQRMQPLRTLYPFDAAIYEMDTTTHVVDLICSLWGGVERHTNSGSYDDRSGEVPIEYQNYLTPNRFVKIGANFWKVVTSVVDNVYSHVSFTVRESV